MSTPSSGPALKLGLIGAGIVASGPYQKALRRLTAVRAAGVVDPDRERAGALARQLGTTVYPDLDALLDDAAIDAVAVLNPNHLHVETALRALGASKHVLIEKPVAGTTAEIDELAAAAQRSGKVCMPAHNYLYNPSVERAKRLIAEGSLGEVASAWILYNIFHDETIARRYGGVLREVCVHHAYTLLYLLGRPRRVGASVSRVHYRELACEDQAMLVCELGNGGLAHLWASFAASDPTNDPWTMVVKVLGTKGGANYSWDDARYDDPGGPAWGIPNYLDGFFHELNFFAHRAIGAGEQPPSTLGDARDALQMIEGAERSLAAGGASVPIDYS